MRRPSDLQSWKIGETYLYLWVYLYRTIDKRGHMIDFFLSPTRNAEPAKRFLANALHSLKTWEKPKSINTGKAAAHTVAVNDLKAQGKYPTDTVHRQVKYLNNRIEAPLLYIA